VEIEGIINHTLAGALVERDYIAQKVIANRIHINFWKDVQRLYANEDIRCRLEDVNHIRQILGSEDYMEYMIEKSPEEPLYYMGFPIKVIEFYIHLKESLRNKLVPEESC